MIARIAYVLRDIADMWTATAVPGPIIVIMAVVLSCFLGLACITGWVLGMFDNRTCTVYLSGGIAVECAADTMWLVYGVGRSDIFFLIAPRCRRHVVREYGPHAEVEVA